MEIPTLRLHKQESEKIQVVLSALVSDMVSASAYLISRSGQEVAFQGQNTDFDHQALASLAAGNLAATSGLAQLVQETEFERIVLQGREQSIVVVPVGDLALLLIVFANSPRNRDVFQRLSRPVILLSDLLDKSNQNESVGVGENSEEVGRED